MDGRPGTSLEGSMYTTHAPQCYCNGFARSQRPILLKCSRCAKLYHQECARQGQGVLILAGDEWYSYTCARCGQEDMQRHVKSWDQIGFIALYNLSLQLPIDATKLFKEKPILQFVSDNWDKLATGHEMEFGTFRDSLLTAFAAHPDVVQSVEIQGETAFGLGAYHEHITIEAVRRQCSGRMRPALAGPAQGTIAIKEERNIVRAAVHGDLTAAQRAELCAYLERDTLFVVGGCADRLSTDLWTWEYILSRCGHVQWMGYRVHERSGWGWSHGDTHSSTLIENFRPTHHTESVVHLSGFPLDKFCPELASDLQAALPLKWFAGGEPCALRLLPTEMRPNCGPTLTVSTVSKDKPTCGAAIECGNSTLDTIHMALNSPLHVLLLEPLSSPLIPQIKEALNEGGAIQYPQRQQFERLLSLQAKYREVKLFPGETLHVPRNTYHIILPEPAATAGHSIVISWHWMFTGVSAAGARALVEASHQAAISATSHDVGAIAPAESALLAHALAEKARFEASKARATTSLLPQGAGSASGRKAKPVLKGLHTALHRLVRQQARAIEKADQRVAQAMTGWEIDASEPVRSDIQYDAFSRRDYWCSTCQAELSNIYFLWRDGFARLCPTCYSSERYREHPLFAHHPHVANDHFTIRQRLMTQHTMDELERGVANAVHDLDASDDEGARRPMQTNVAVPMRAPLVAASPNRPMPAPAPAPAQQMPAPVHHAMPVPVPQPARAMPMPVSMPVPVSMPLPVAKPAAAAPAPMDTERALREAALRNVPARSPVVAAAPPPAPAPLAEQEQRKRRRDSTPDREPEPAQKKPRLDDEELPLASLATWQTSYQPAVIAVGAVRAVRSPPPQAPKAYVPSTMEKIMVEEKLERKQEQAMERQRSRSRSPMRDRRTPSRSPRRSRSRSRSPRRSPRRRSGSPPYGGGPGGGGGRGHQKRIQPGPTAVRMAQIPANVRDDELRDMLDPAGVVIEMTVVRAPNGDCKGYGYALFDNEAAVERALKLNARIGSCDVRIMPHTGRDTGYRPRDQRDPRDRGDPRDYGRDPRDFGRDPRDFGRDRPDERRRSRSTSPKKEKKRRRRGRFEGRRAVFVENVPFDCTEETLSEALSVFGKVTAVKVERNEDGIGKGTAWGRYEEEASAIAAAKSASSDPATIGRNSLNITRWMDCPEAQEAGGHHSPSPDREKPHSPSPGRRESPRRDSPRRDSPRRDSPRRRSPSPNGRRPAGNALTGPTVVFVQNMPREVRDDDLRDVLRGAGEIMQLRIIRDQWGFCKGFGYVQFDVIESAQRALGMHPPPRIDSRELRLEAWQERPSSGSRGRGGFRGGRGGYGRDDYRRRSRSRSRSGSPRRDYR